MSTNDHQALVLAYRTADRVEVRSLAAHLEDAEIVCHIVGEFRDTAYPGLALGSMPEKEIWVSRSDQTAASTIVDQWMRDHHPMDRSSESDVNWTLWKLIGVIAIVELALGLASRGPWGLAIAAVVNVGITVAFFVLAVRRLKQKREALALEESRLSS